MTRSKSPEVTLEKTYDAGVIEPRLSKKWEDEGVFKAGAGAGAEERAFSIVIPPPNVTGSLHMGHALNCTIQDILARFERMRGKNVLWQPGMDHAGIATQMVVERQLAARGEADRRSLGREAFIERVWQWRAESGGMIANQLRRLGASCDWSRERFTMDEGLSRAVVEVFVRLYKQDLIYKDKRLVNWDPKLGTAISDLEVEQREVQGHLWHFRYPLAGKNFNPEDPTTFITVATTRPETMLGDSGVAVNEADERHQNLIGTAAILPLVGRLLPIVGDDYADPEAGSGAVKITPAHDFNDFEVGRRHGLRVINIMSREAKIILRDNADFLNGLEEDLDIGALIAEFDGLDRFAARALIVKKMEEGGYLAKIEEHTHSVPHGDRGGVPIEPFLTEQWYVKAAVLAEPAMAAVRDGRTQIIPQNWEKIYFQWLENIEPWCISRQLWWGHQIPAWYGPDGTIFVEKSEEEALVVAAAHYGEPTALNRDEDVLDTWFSSALWPFSTMGWPDQTRELALYYPTSVLVTGFDLIFFWIARMMMMGLHFTGEVPFRTVYMHALVRDKDGAKMSKSKGNVIDPLDLIDEYGADALRFTLSIMAAQGRDVKLDPARIAGYRNFGTKLWNASRFAIMNGVAPDPNFKPQQARIDVNRWILTSLTRAAIEVTQAIETYRFNEAARCLYKFVWHTVCDWYLELIKPILQGSDEAAATEIRQTTAFVLVTIYKLLHPFMPYITEELSAHMVGEKTAMLALSSWPQLDFTDESAADDLDWLIEIITSIRSLRAEMNVPAGAKARLVVLEQFPKSVERFSDKNHDKNQGQEISDSIKARFGRHEAALARLARISAVEFADSVPSQAAQMVVAGITICLPLGELIDVAAERARLTKECDKTTREVEKIHDRLANQQFIANAREDVIEQARAKLAEMQERQTKLTHALSQLR